VTKYSQIGIAICVCACVMALSGCVRQQRDSDANALGVPNIEGDKIIFLTNAPQLAYLRIEPAQELKAAVIGLNGRLMWDDDVTARVFPSVSGRIVEICADLGQHISAGDALAKIRSPISGKRRLTVAKPLPI
jgi:multidrug efflux pump subunit AcrA (membrane-fusion protein)